MTRRRKYIIAIAFCFLAYKFLWTIDPILSWSYDLLTQQDSVEEFSTDRFHLIDFSELPEGEKSKFKNRDCHSFNFENTKFIEVEWFDRYKNLIDNTKIYTLLTPDRLIGNRIRIPNLAKTQYLLIDSDVIYVYQKLIAELNEKDLNTSEMEITSGFRNPEYNKMVGGATCSQHQMGTAIDIYIGDLNKDGIEDKTDRRLVYKILENKLIKNKGGIGKYKNHPKLIHFDIRGHRARW